MLILLVVHQISAKSVKEIVGIKTNPLKLTRLEFPKFNGEGLHVISA